MTADPRSFRIAHAVPAGLDVHDGVRTVVTTVARELAQRGHDVELWTLHSWSGHEMQAQGDELVAAGVTIVDVTATGGIRTLAAREVDLVHLHSVFTPANARIAGSLTVPYVVSPHGGYAGPSLRRSRLRKLVYARLIERRYVRRAAMRHALTDQEAAQVRAFGGPGPLRVIPNGVAAPSSGERVTAEWRRSLGVDEDVPIALFVGRLDVEHKGLDRLIVALTAAPGWHGALVGPDHRGGETALRRLAAAHGVEGRLHLVGPLRGAALEDAFAAADLFVLPSRWEGMPMSLLEALARAVPALVTPAVEAAVPVAATGAGWVAPPGELGATLDRPEVRDRRELATRGRAARQLAARYHWPRVAEQYEDAYRAVLAAQGR